VVLLDDKIFIQILYDLVLSIRCNSDSIQLPITTQTKDETMNAQTLTAINTLTTRRNLAARKLLQLGDNIAADVRTQLFTFVIGADARVRAMGVRLVAMPGRPGAVVADVFLSMLSDD
jgi:hypothetical protein